MKFKVVWMRARTVIGTKDFDALVEATSYAEENLGSVVSSFGATAVKIVSEDGEAHYLKSLSR